MVTIDVLAADEVGTDTDAVDPRTTRSGGRRSAGRPAAASTQ